MATTFALNHLGVTFRAKLVDCVSGKNINLGTVAEQFIVFYKPDGTRFEKTATIVNLDANDFISYTNTTPETESILDLIGKWEYAGKVKLDDGDEFESPERFVFWVI